jgi:hypothetical protein
VAQAYDVIGDIHGQALELKALLGKLGYVDGERGYTHPHRKVIFLGDFVDRGDYQVEVLRIVRQMVEEGHALAVMGNHEYNAIGYVTLGQDGNYLRSRSSKNTHQHAAFIDAYQETPEAWTDAINWFKTLPLWLDLEGCRVIHACWDDALVTRLQERDGGGQLMSDDLLHTAADRNQWEYDAVDSLLKGKELPLEEGLFFHDKDGHRRNQIRIRWWDGQVKTYREAYMGPEEARAFIPVDPLPAQAILGYDPAAKPIFIGHYWLTGNPAPLADNIACVDYSVARPGGKLVAYRWDGEQTLSVDKFVWVERQ